MGSQVQESWVKSVAAAGLGMLAVGLWVAQAAAAPPKKDGKAKPWDVNAPPGPTKTVDIEVTEGTWMSLDVSPSGTHVVFDLLGDIYEVPLAGGKAKALTQGMAWDMHPRYSPDGKWIAFTSDRGGGDNLWVMPVGGDLDSDKAHAVSGERFRLVTQPTWSPDGRFVAGRKHFTSRRSLGAGEIWLWHAMGNGKAGQADKPFATAGSGVQVTKRQSEQKDLGEPAFSPDGRWIYYSRDASPGKTFQYNKDPNKQIYAIERVDLVEGTIEKVAGGPGGAIRPTPSPDGKWLAYVRRDRGRTVLTLRDLRSGAERALSDRLDRDLQETWAIHGVYPAMAWTPDSAEVVYWAAGGLHRVAVKTAVSTPIPFKVRSKRRFHETLRQTVPVAPERFGVKMLRWVTPSPDGSRVVFEALGKLWIREIERRSGGKLEAGPVRRLTADSSETFELTPAFSRDGSKVVFATWHDVELGQLRVVDAAGGGQQGAKAQVLTDQPGHYLHPQFSPDGRSVVYERVKDGWTRSATYSTETGIFVRPAQAGGAEKRLLKTGSRPHFASDAGRLFYAGRAKDKQTLESLELGTGKTRVHAQGKGINAYRVSPDGRWVAFQAHWNVHVVPLTVTAKPFDVGLKGKAWPQAKVSADAGQWLSWSGQSDALRWAMGPTLFEQPLERAMPFLAEGKRGDKAVPAREGAIGFEAATDMALGTYALVGVRLVTMDAPLLPRSQRGEDWQSSQVIEDGTIVWKDGKIVALGPRAEVKVPAEATLLERGPDTTVFPGFIDVHAHGSQGRQGIIPQRNWLNWAMLAFGTTTMHDPSNHTETVFAAAELQRAGRIVGPRLFSTGTILYGAEAPSFMARIDSLDDARMHLKRLKAVGAFSVKSYNQPRRDQRQQVIEAGRELGMVVVPEGGALFMHNMTQVVDGHTGVEHALPIARVYEDVLQLWEATEAGITPTLNVAYGGLGGERYWYAKTDVWKHPRLTRFVPRFALDPVARRPQDAPAGEWNHQRAARVCRDLNARGVRVHVGAHGQREGLGVHWEMWGLVQGGMTPFEALRSGTASGAEYLGMQGEIGSLKVGMLADLAVVDGNPMDDIRLSENVRYTVQGGRVWEALSMRQVAPDPEPAPTFFFQRSGEPPGGPEHGPSHCGCRGTHQH